MEQVLTTSTSQQRHNASTSDTIVKTDWSHVWFVTQSILIISFAVLTTGLSIVNSFVFISEIIPAAIILTLIAIIRLAAGKQ